MPPDMHLPNKAELISTVRFCLSLLVKKPRIVTVAGIILAIWIGTAPWRSLVPVTEQAIAIELGKEGDWRNLYFAAQAAHWSDAPKWFVGSWIYPDVAYYRPVTSMLFLAEQKLWDRNFTSYNRVSLAFHALNCGFTYLLVLSLFRNHPRAKYFLGLIAVNQCMTLNSPVQFGISKGISWWPAQNDIVSLTFALGFLWCFERSLFTGRRRWLAAAIASLLLSLGSKEMAYIAPVMAAGLAVPSLRNPAVRRKTIAFLSSILVITSAMWILRKLTVPNAWGPVWGRTHLISKALLNWFGPVYFQICGNDWWAITGAVATILFGIAAWKKRIPFWFALSGSAICLVVCAQWLPGGSTWALLFDDRAVAKLYECFALFLFVLLVIWGYKREKSILIYGWYLLVYIPILQYGGQHYFYWPSPFLGFSVALFTALGVTFAWENILPRFPKVNILLQELFADPDQSANPESVIAQRDIA